LSVAPVAALLSRAFAAYGRPPPLTDDEVLAKSLDLNLAMSKYRPRRG
jgi:hypothetical protein